MPMGDFSKDQIQFLVQTDWLNSKLAD